MVITKNTLILILLATWEALLAEVVVPLLLSPGIVVGHLTVLLLGVLELLQGDVLRHNEVAVLV